MDSNVKATLSCLFTWSGSGDVSRWASSEYMDANDMGIKIQPTVNKSSWHSAHSRKLTVKERER